MQVLITGSSGLIGSESVKFFSEKGFEVTGIDNDMRSYFFGSGASTKKVTEKLKSTIPNYKHLNIDIRNRREIEELMKNNSFDLIIHTAAQPSHDWAAKEPYTDFGVNAYGTLVLLESFRKHNPQSTFIFTSTNKVYGDLPNKFDLVEHETRFELNPSVKFAKEGFDETLSIDQSTHSIFGSSKVAADILVQEYGKYFDLNTCVLRGGCLTGPAHQGAELHGFLAYLVKSINEGKKYTIFGYKGKQVRDNIHSYDFVNAMYSFFKNPKKGEVYNMGGSRHSNISVEEAIRKIEMLLGKKAIYEYSDQPRKGDHIWYISDVSKFKKHFPEWGYKYDIDRILREMCEAVQK
ncbi:MAG: NAD-dependent epimerase/dehydratase family protein [Patescibacteria group bacterium]|nr:NAD-dependent epimerase/dehydratase family protein [Patescibacteria group bacterium]